MNDTKVDHRHNLNNDGNRHCSDPKSHVGRYDGEIAWAIDHAKTTVKCYGGKFIFTYNVNTGALRAESVYLHNAPDTEKDGKDQTREGGTRPLYKRLDREHSQPYFAKSRDEFLDILGGMVADIEAKKCTAFGGYQPSLRKMYAREDSLPEFAGGPLKKVIEKMTSEKTSGELGKHRDGTLSSVDVVAY
ncbi:MAG: hypothetical protein V1870_00650 [Candidatus Aenigmatarchaeota archaeon]